MDGFERFADGRVITARTLHGWQLAVMAARLDTIGGTAPLLSLSRIDAEILDGVLNFFNISEV